MEEPTALSVAKKSSKDADEDFEYEQSEENASPMVSSTSSDSDLSLRRPFYNLLTKEFKKYDGSTLASLIYSRDFIRKSTSDPYIFRYFRLPSEDILSAVLLMEMRGEDCGTLLAPTGDATMPLTTNSVVRYRLRGGIPSCATQEVTNLYFRQVSTLRQILCRDRQGDLRSSSFRRKLKNRDILHYGVLYSSPLQGGDAELITLFSESIYHKGNLPDEFSFVENYPCMASRKDGGSYTRPTLQVGEVGTPYAIDACFPDKYNNSLLDQAPKYLRQLDIRDIEGALIPPWEIKMKLRSGTLVLCTVELFSEYNGIVEPKERNVEHTYTMVARKLRVIRESEAPETDDSAVADVDRRLPPSRHRKRQQTDEAFLELGSLALSSA